MFPVPRIQFLVGGRVEDVLCHRSPRFLPVERLVTRAPHLARDRQPTPATVAHPHVCGPLLTCPVLPSMDPRHSPFRQFSTASSSVGVPACPISLSINVEGAQLSVSRPLPPGAQIDMPGVSFSFVVIRDQHRPPATVDQPPHLTTQRLRYVVQNPLFLRHRNHARQHEDSSWSFRTDRKRGSRRGRLPRKRRDSPALFVHSERVRRGCASRSISVPRRTQFVDHVQRTRTEIVQWSAIHVSHTSHCGRVCQPDKHA
jgi:hypothetical protein